ncbi:MAG: LytTR family transcriptional regulator DNA-binding domain-containing protein [Bacteroidota bacterium]
MNCLIIDDNAKTSAVLQQLLEAQPGAKNIHIAVQPYLIRSLMSYETIDVVFIRVRLWDFRQFAHLGQKPAIVFLSGGKDKLTEKPGTSVLFSMREPYSEREIKHLLKRITDNTLSEGNEFLFLRYSGRFHKTLFTDIEMVERMEKAYVKFHLSYGAPLIPGTIPGWRNKLPEDRFIRVSDNLILPVEKVVGITEDRYVYKQREIVLTFRFAGGARNEMEHWPDGL